MNPIIFSMFGTTPGKALLAIEVTAPSGDPLSFGQALKRSFGVWFYGWGMGIPLVCLFTLLRAHDNLTQKKITTWDRQGNFHVSHGRIGAVRGTAATVLIVGLFALFVNLKEEAKRHNREQILRAITADFSEAIRLNPKDAEAYYNRGKAYEKKGDYDKAIANYTEAIRLDPKLALAHNNLGVAYANKGDWDKAIADCTEAIRLDPKLEEVYNNRGAMYFCKGDLDAAIADYNEAIRLGPKNGAAYYWRGCVYEVKGKSENANKDFAKAKALGYKPPGR